MTKEKGMLVKDMGDGSFLVTGITGEKFLKQNFPEKFLRLVEAECKSAKTIILLLEDIHALYKAGINRVIMIKKALSHIHKKMVFICPGMCPEQMELLKKAGVESSKEMI